MAGSLPEDRILFVHHAATLGDDERSLLEIAVGLRERGAVALFEDGLLAAALVSRNVAIIPISGESAQSRGRKRRGSVVASARAAYALSRVARSFGVLVAYSPAAFLISAAAGLLAGRPVIWHLRDILDDRHFDRLRVRVLVGFANVRAARVVASTQIAADAFVAAGGRRALIRVVHDGVDTAPFERISPQTRTDVREALGIDERAYVIGSFADAPGTRPRVLLDALEMLSGVIALVVGSSAGYGDGVARLIAACDVIVDASDAPEPSAIVQALLGRRPLIASDTGSVRELVEDGVTAILVPLGDASALAMAITSLRDEPVRGDELAFAGFADASQRFSRASMVASMTRVVDEVLSERPRSARGASAVSASYELTRCIVCEGADTRELACADDVRGEIELLWAHHSRRLRPDTPPPNLMDRVAFSQRPPLRVVRCTSCGLVYRNPIERPAELEHIYGRESPTTEVMQALHDTQRASYAAQAKRLTSVAGRCGSGIEVGSYVGAFLAAARTEGWQFAGVDINECANHFTRALGFEVHDGPIESLDPNRRVDAVAIWNCLDQLADPPSAIRAARRHLRVGGLLALRVPNGACYAALLPLPDSPLSFVAREWLAQNNLLGFPYRFGFTPASAGRLVEKLGFEVVRVVGDVLVPIADEWTRPWAALEERALKRVGHVAARMSFGDRPLAPWFELYARVT